MGSRRLAVFVDVHTPIITRSQPVASMAAIMNCKMTRAVVGSPIPGGRTVSAGPAGAGGGVANDGSQPATSGTLKRAATCTDDVELEAAEREQGSGARCVS